MRVGHIENHIRIFCFDGLVQQQSGRKFLVDDACPNVVMVSSDLLHRLRHASEETPLRDERFQKMKWHWMDKGRSPMKQMFYFIQFRQRRICSQTHRLQKQRDREHPSDTMPMVDANSSKTRVVRDAMCAQTLVHTLFPAMHSTCYEVENGSQNDAPIAEELLDEACSPAGWFSFGSHAVRMTTNTRLLHPFGRNWLDRFSFTDLIKEHQEHLRKVYLRPGVLHSEIDEIVVGRLVAVLDGEHTFFDGDRLIAMSKSDFNILAGIVWKEFQICTVGVVRLLAHLLSEDRA